MPTLRRSLKYTPTVVMGLLVVVWVVSWPIWFGVEINGYVKNGVNTGIRWEDGYLVFAWAERKETDNLRGLRSISFQHRTRHPTRPSLRASLPPYLISDGFLWVSIPIIALATALLPLAIGLFISFRFRLWQYVAYTALVAVELAYYLRW
jgi:hypothetical protein